MGCGCSGQRLIIESANFPEAKSPDPKDTTGTSDSNFVTTVPADTRYDYQTRADKQGTSLRWLFKEEFSQHNACGNTCEVRQMLEELDDKVKVDFDTIINKKIISDATKLVDGIVKVLNENDPLFACTVERRGSSTNNLKTGRLDEIDFLLKLEHFRLRHRYGWRLKRDHADYDPRKLTSSARQDMKHAAMNFQIGGLREDLGYYVFRDLCSEAIPLLINKGRLHERLSAKEVKGRFITSVAAAVRKVHSPDTSNNNVRFTTNFDEFSGELIMFPYEVSFAVKIDITPCVTFIDCDKRPRCLVPRSSLNNWQVANSDPEEVGCETVRQAVRIFKLLRDISEDSHYAIGLHETVLAFSESQRGCNYQPLLSDSLTDFFGQAKSPKTHTTLPSYAILGTVIRSYRRNSTQPLCSLVLQSVADFDFISPDGTPLCGHYTRREVASCARVLTGLLTSAPAVTMIPTFYQSIPLSGDRILQDLTDSKQGVVVWVKGSDKGVWKLYRIDRVAFINAVRKLIPQKGKGYTENQLRNELEQLRRDETVQHVYVAVLSLENACFNEHFALSASKPQHYLMVSEIVKELSEATPNISSMSLMDPCKTGTLL